MNRISDGAAHDHPTGPHAKIIGAPEVADALVSQLMGPATLTARLLVLRLAFVFCVAAEAIDLNESYRLVGKDFSPERSTTDQAYAVPSRGIDLEALATVPSGLIIQTYREDVVFDGYLVTCPEYDQSNLLETYHGPRIYHPNGAVFWAGTQYKTKCMNAQLQTWKGQRVLTFWVESPEEGDYGAILDENYNEIKRVRINGAHDVDPHEFRITPTQDSALIIGGRHRDYDLSIVGGGPKDGVYDPFVQEVDIETGDLLWEWDATDFLDLRNTYHRLDDHHSWEFAHTNAVVKDEDGNYIISYRFYHSIFKIDGRTKDIIWTLGGKGSDFTFGNGSDFVGQHDPQWVPGTNYTEMTIFDNDYDFVGYKGPYGTARGIWIRLDYSAMHVTLVREYIPRVRKRTGIEGGIQLLPNGNVLVSYGSSGSVIEYCHTPRKDGAATPTSIRDVISAGQNSDDDPYATDIVFEGWTNRVYRAFKYPKDYWHGGGLPDPLLQVDRVEVDDDVSLVFHSTTQVAACGFFRAILGLC